jgi:hypothetical protein
VESFFFKTLAYARHKKDCAIVLGKLDRLPTPDHR